MSPVSPTKIWTDIHAEAVAVAAREKPIAAYLKDMVLSQGSLAEFLAHFLPLKLESSALSRAQLRKWVESSLAEDPKIIASVAKDILAICDRDPACKGKLNAVLFYKGFHALTAYRIARQHLLGGRPTCASLLQNVISEKLAADIHPAARIGCGVFIDHGTGLVIGETAVVGDTVSILHEVTLGGTGKQSGDRHPKVGTGVLIGAGAKILGNVIIGEYAKVGAGSVVLRDVPAHSVVAGVPARVLRAHTGDNPAQDMDQFLKEKS